MKLVYIFIFPLLVNLAMSGKSYSQDDFPLLEGAYLGQKPPGLIPEVFAPGIVTTEEYGEGNGVFTPDMKEFYFVRYGRKYEKRTLFVIQYKNHRWRSESVVSTDVRRPFISTDGNIMYSGNKYMERTNSGWSEIKSLGAPFKDICIMRLTVSSKGTYCFDFAEMEGNGYIRYSRLIVDRADKVNHLQRIKGFCRI